ncbi:uncharacterized protein BKA78DRAFT_325705 [Phyllosticta capitalensis]|uniref:uncharacterized protein n=1 Tax=Phyllosticta capitalensis TaxID=121624 RepID=UPI00312DDF28
MAMGNACCLLQPALVVLSTSTSNPYRGQGLHLGIKRHPTGRSEYFRRHTHFTNEYATQKGGATNTPAWRQTNAFAPPHQPAVPLNGPSISKFSAFSLGSSNDWGWDSNQLGGWCWHLRFPTYWKSQHVGAHNSTFRFFTRAANTWRFAQGSFPTKTSSFCRGNFALRPSCGDNDLFGCRVLADGGRWS